MLRVSCLAACGLLLLGLVLILTCSHGHVRFRVRVTGQLIRAGDYVPLSDALVVVTHSRHTAESRSMMRSVRERARRGQDWPPRSVGVATTDVLGHLDLVMSVTWTVHRIGPFRTNSRFPPPGHGVAYLRVEMRGREPVILDAPHGTWTEHPDDDDLWATYDLGVVEVPSGP